MVCSLLFSGSKNLLFQTEFLPSMNVSHTDCTDCGFLLFSGSKKVVVPKDSAVWNAYHHYNRPNQKQYSIWKPSKTKPCDRTPVHTTQSMISMWVDIKSLLLEMINMGQFRGTSILSNLHIWNPMGQPPPLGDIFIKPLGSSPTAPQPPGFQCSASASPRMPGKPLVALANCRTRRSFWPSQLNQRLIIWSSRGEDEKRLASMWN